MRGSWVRVPEGSQKGCQWTSFVLHRPGAEIGRQAWLRAMCPLGRAGSSPALGTLSAYLSSTRVAKLVDAQSSGGCAFGRAGSSPAPGTTREAIER